MTGPESIAALLPTAMQAIDHRIAERRRLDNLLDQAERARRRSGELRGDLEREDEQGQVARHQFETRP